MSISGIFIYIFITIILAILFINLKSYVCLALGIILLLFLIKKYGFKFSFVLAMIFGFFCIYRVNSKPVIELDTIESKVFVLEAKPSYLIVKDDNVKYLIYYENDNEIFKGDYLLIKGSINELEDDLDIDVFDFNKYLKNKRVYYSVELSSVELSSDVNKYYQLINKITYSMTNNLENESYSMSKMLLFNDKYSSIDTYENLKEINALHLFVVSGFHISFLYSILAKILKRTGKIGTFISYVVCIFYVFLLDFSISSTRALISLLIGKVMGDKLNRVDSVAIPGILFLVIEPLNIFNYSFIMSFLMSFILAFISKPLNKVNKLTSIILTSLICFIAMVPIILLINYEINFISIVSNILLSYAVMVIFVLCIIGIPLSFINGDIFSNVYKLFNNIVSKIALIDSKVILGAPKDYMVVIYYLLVIGLIISLEKANFKKIFAFFFLIIVSFIAFYNKSYLTFYQQVTFLNVYQGDCIIIQDSFSDKVMLIDTGGLTYYDIASKKIIPYLTYNGIRKIDTVVITHQDNDHKGALESLSSQIQIDNIIEDYEIDEVHLGKIALTNLNKYYNDDLDENDKSIVLYGNISGYDFLFMGDATSYIESKIIIDNPDLSVDVLKVGHHGSKSSSSKEFIDLIVPSYSIISVGKNYYGHPTSEVLERLEDVNSIIYRTDMEGTIRFKGLIFNKCYIETAR